MSIRTKRMETWGRTRLVQAASASTSSAAGAWALRVRTWSRFSDTADAGSLDSILRTAVWEHGEMNSWGK